MNKFKPVYIETTTLDNAWYQLLREAYYNGRRYKITSGSREGLDRIALDFAAGFMHYPHTRPLAPRMPEGSTLPPPTSEEKIESYFVDYLLNPNYTKKEHYKYSEFICGSDRFCSGINQIEWIINHFKVHGYGNDHCFLTVGYPEQLLTYDNPYMYCNKCRKYYGHAIKICEDCGELLQIDEFARGSTPCLRGLDFRIVDGYLTTNIIYRSWSLEAGLPENIGGMIMLNEYVADQLGDVKPGPVSFCCKSLHVYSDYLDLLNMRFE